MSTVAWFRFEGVLVPRTTLACATWMAARHHDVLGRVGRVGAGWLGRGLAFAGDPGEALRLAFRGVAGASEDRIAILSEDWADAVIADGLHAPGCRLLDRARDQGLTPVLVATHPEGVVARVAQHLGVDHHLANHLEIVDGFATGRLTSPVVTGHLDRRRLEADAHARGLSTQRACAYGHAAEDTAFLAAAPRPCAVTPTPRLRRLAQELGWPIVEARP